MDREIDLQMKQLFVEIEGAALDAAITQESSMRRILKVLESSGTVRRLVTAIQSSHLPAEDVLSRMSRLAGTSVDFRYRNPRDTALAAYLYAIIVSAPRYLYVACRIVLTAPNTWLSNQIVGIIIKEWARSYTLGTQVYSAATPEAWSTSATSQGGTKRENVGDFIQIAPFHAQKMYPGATLTSYVSEKTPMSQSSYNVANSIALWRQQIHMLGAQNHVTEKPLPTCPRSKVL